MLTAFYTFWDVYKIKSVLWYLATKWLKETNYTVMQVTHWFFLSGAVHSVQTSVTGNLSCCGNQSYFPRQELCCSQETDKIVITKTASDHDQCCPNGPTGQLYSSCKRAKPGPSNLCGKEPYNQSRDLCCNNEVHRDGKALGKKCCMSSTWAYFENNETCCFNQVKPKALG